MNLRFLLYAALCLIAGISKAQSLSGRYTIGGSSPDYVNFNAAVRALKINGVSGTVVFSVRTGDYNEQIKLEAFTGSSFSNMVTFQSESGNRDDVVLHHEHTTTATNGNHTIFIDGADYLTFQNLTIKADPENVQSDDQNRVIYIQNNSDNIKFINNNIVSWYTTNSNFEYVNCIFVGADYTQNMDNDSIVFRGNSIVGGDVGMQLQGSHGAGGYQATGWVIENNTFTDQGGQAIRVQIAMNTRITGNIIEGTHLPSFVGIMVDQCNDSLLIDKNTIRISGTGMGIQVMNLQRGNATFKQLSNNMITMGPDYVSFTPAAIQVRNSCPLIIAHNSVSMYGSFINGTCLQNYGSDTLLIYNNQFANYTGQPSFILNTTNSQIFSSNNNLYSSGFNFASFNGTSYSNIGDLQSGTGQESNSINVDPQYFSNYLLIPYAPGSYGSGTPLSSVPTDVFGTVRSGTTPNIGVFEGPLPVNDAAVTGSTLDSYLACPKDTLDIYIRFKNMGSANLTSLDLYCTNNEATYGPINWTGSLSQNQSDSVLVQNLTFTQAQQVEVKMYCSNPNGRADQILVNDTNNYQSPMSLNGLYTIGASGRDYSSFTAAVNDLITYGVCGPVIFEADSGSYNEQFIIPVITGTSATNTVTFRSAMRDSSDVEIWFFTNQHDNYVINLTGAEYMRFEHLRIYGRGSSRQTGINITEGASNNVFSNCHILGTTKSANNYNALVYMRHYGTKKLLNNVFRDNRFENGGYQLRYLSYSFSGAEDLEITGNIFTGTSGGGIELEYFNDIILTDNEFEGTNYSTSVAIEDCRGTILVEKNKFTSATNMRGLLFKDCSASSVIVRNNFFASSSGNLDIQGTSNARIINNSFHCINAGLANISLYNNNTGLKIYNNAMKHSSDGNCIWAPYNLDSSLVQMNYNSFFTDGSAIVKESNIEYNLAEWQALRGLELTSVFVDPLYTTDTDLHIVNATALKQAGITTSYVTDDIDSELRKSTAPDIGADEFPVDSSQYYDVWLYAILDPDTTLCSAPDSLVVSVINQSNFALDSLDIKWSLFGVTKDSSTYVVHIPSQDTATLTLPPFKLTPNTHYNFEFEALLPNGQPDNYFNNNTLPLEYQYLDQVQIQKRSRSDCPSNLELYVAKSAHISVLWSTGETTKSIVPAGPGTYSVTITDNFGCTSTDSIVVN